MFWISWLLTAQIMNGIAAFILVLAGYLAQFGRVLYRLR